MIIMTQFNSNQIAQISENIYCAIKNTMPYQLFTEYVKTQIQQNLLWSYYMQLTAVQEFYQTFRIQRANNRQYMRIALLTEELAETRIAAENLVKWWYAVHNTFDDEIENESDVAYQLFAEWLDGLADIMYILHGGIIEFMQHDTELTELNKAVYQDGFYNKGRIFYPELVERVLLQVRSISLNYYSHSVRKFADYYAEIVPRIVSFVYTPILNFTELAPAERIELITLIAKVFQEVHAANMRKLDENGQPILRGDGKILKPIDWQPADLIEVIKNSPFADVSLIIRVAANLKLLVME